jgi:poly(3-hydroxybutyrate) depolymerase
VYPYSTATWDAIAKDGICRFDIEGLMNVLQDVRTAYHGEERIYLTGFEAGAHLVWAFVFRHPELLAAASPAAGNYRGRCMEDQKFSVDPARISIKLPIRAIQGQLDTLWGPGGGGFAQWLDAKQLAQAHGYADVTETLVPGKGHVPMPEEVLGYFMSLQTPISFRSKAASRAIPG